MKALLGFALVLFSANAFATTVVSLPKGAKAEKYRYTYSTNQEPASLSVCGVYAKHLTHEGVLNNTVVVSQDGPFYTNLKVSKPIELTLISVDTQYREGTDCHYQGFPGEDVDWKCSDAIRGAWAVTTMFFKDAYGNTWHSNDQTAMFAERSQVGAWDDIGKAAIKNLEQHLEKYCAQ